MAELLTSYQGLIGVVAGGLLVYLTGLLSQGRAWKREDRLRGYEFRRDAYVKLLTVADRINEGETGQEIFSEMKRAYMNVRLVTYSEEVEESAEQLMVAMALLATGNTGGIERGWDPMDEFLRAARVDLELPLQVVERSPVARRVEKRRG